MAFDVAQWFKMTALSATFAAFIHLISGIIIAIRIKKWSGVIFVIAFFLYTFVSGFFYSLFTSLIITLTYAASINDLNDTISTYWALGLGAFYVLLKALIQILIKQRYYVYTVIFQFFSPNEVACYFLISLSMDFLIMPNN